jgi:bifunctional non-homologous end joining protein LigD
LADISLHPRKHDHEVQLDAFDILAPGGNDLRSLSLHMRKQNLAQLLARRPRRHHGRTVRAWRDWS